MRWYDLGAVTVGGWKLTKRRLGIVCLLNCGFSQCWYVVSVCVQIEEMDPTSFPGSFPWLGKRPWERGWDGPRWVVTFQTSVSGLFCFPIQRILRISPSTKIGNFISILSWIVELFYKIYPLHLTPFSGNLNLSSLTSDCSGRGTICGFQIFTKKATFVMSEPNWNCSNGSEKLFTTEKCALARYSLFYKLTKKL